MALLTIIACLFLASLVAGQLGGIMIAPGIVIYLHDFLIPPLLVLSLLAVRRFPRMKLGGPVVGFATVAIASLVVNCQGYTPLELFQSSLYAVRWILYAGVYLVVVSGIRSDRFWLYGIYAVSVAVSALGLIQYSYYPTLRNLYYLGWDEHYYRLFSTFLDPNFAGIFIALGFLLGLSFLIATKDRFKKQILAIPQLILFVGLLLTYSRSSFVAFTVGVMAILGLYRKFTMILVFFVIFLGIVVVLPTRNRDILRITRAESAMARIGNWRQSVDLFLEKPILGHGFNTLRIIQLQRGWKVDEPIVSRGAGGVDNSILFVAITTGSFGVVVYLYFLYRVVRSGILLLGFAKEKPVAVTFLGSLSAVAVHSLFVNSLFYPWILLWMWIFTGAIEARATADR